MRPAQRFTIRQTIPEHLSGLRQLATNLRWAWDPDTKDLFHDLDPAAWETSEEDPLRALDLIPAKRWDELADDQSIARRTNEATERLDAAVNEPRWFQQRSSTPLQRVAYFSPEFGLSETLAQYSGGLGVLAGDHLKSASDLGIPLVAIGLLYREGYFHQRLDADGWQDERFPVQDPTGLAVTPTGVTLTVDLAGDTVEVAVWRVDVGRIPLYLLDTTSPANSVDGQGITDRLYGGDVEHRLRQEIILGIGGIRALRALGIEPQVFHTNEGHAGFLSLERIREHVADGLTFDEAVEATRAGGLFTTHTPVPAGIDRFPTELMAKYFTDFAAQCGTSLEHLESIGHRDDEPEETRFNMAVMGMRLAARSNGVAALHGAVSREMFHGLWPDVALDEVPIGSVTNGVHAHTWVSPRVNTLFNKHVHPVWDGADAGLWSGVTGIDDETIWKVRNEGRQELVSWVRAHFGDDLLDPDVLTIGFARRFATYKRATLLLSQPDRLKALLRDPDRPIQFVFAGKAHPADNPGKEMIQTIERFSREAGVQSSFVFMSDYDMAMARAMYHGADVWLNNPRRPLEACGTSGMKAALNGALNCSILDGWWDEAYDGKNGWAIDSAEEEPDVARRDQREATSLFGLLENEIVPLFYKRKHGVPHGWIKAVKHNWATVGPAFTAARMVRDYTADYYEPAAAAATRITSDDCAPAKALAAWKARIRSTWASVSVLSIDAPETSSARGFERSVAATVDLGDVAEADVVVQVVHGPLDADGSFTKPVTEPLTISGHRGDTTMYAGVYRPVSAGPYGVTVRVLPFHTDLANAVDLGLVAWADSL